MCRQLMVDLKREMAAIHESTTRNTLIYLSAARFDQQETTRPHLDGGPNECFLMLGYEPSEVDAELVIFDYTKCAFDLGLWPKDFMAKHNPMFQSRSDYVLARLVAHCCAPLHGLRTCVAGGEAGISESRGKIATRIFDGQYDQID